MDNLTDRVSLAVDGDDRSKKISLILLILLKIQISRLMCRSLKEWRRRRGRFEFVAGTVCKEQVKMHGKGYGDALRETMIPYTRSQFERYIRTILAKA